MTIARLGIAQYIGHDIATLLSEIPDVLLLEINEFNPDLMQQAAAELDAPHLKKLLALKKSHTRTDDAQERYGLDPWVQWVSIHTGKPSSEHGIKHLADLSRLHFPQIWETLGQNGYRCGVWGPMNARKGDGKGLDFFITDPWSFEQVAYPEYLNDFLALPVYYAKNYGHINALQVIKTFLKTLRFLLRPSVFFALLPQLPKMLGLIFREGFKNHVLFVLFDLVNAILFVRFYKKYKPDFSILFMNSLAHLQHHKWSSKTELSHEMRVTFQMVDRILDIIFSGIPENESLVVTNSFTQVCTVDDKEYLYRQKNPEGFLHAANIRFNRIEQLMTNDAHIFFANEQDARSALKILLSAKLDGQAIFNAEWDEKFPTRLFYQLSFWKAVNDQTILEIAEKKYRFLDHFYCVTQRKGSHSATGHVFSSDIDFPPELYNHQIYDHVINAFKIKSSLIRTS